MARNDATVNQHAAGMPRAPCPITWDEQDRLFTALPARLARMVLFAVNTGLRESNVCGLEWTWEVRVPEIDRSVFVIPAEGFKSRRAHVVILKDVAWSIIQSQRGLHRIRAFAYRGKRVSTAWQSARREQGLQRVRISRSSAHLRLPLARRGRISRRSGGTARPRQSFDGRPLRERRCWPPAQASEPSVQPRRFVVAGALIASCLRPAQRRRNARYNKRNDGCHASHQVATAT